MSWFEKVMNWVDWFFNKPLPIVGVSLCIVCIVIFRLFARSSFGKKLYTRVEKDFEETKGKVLSKTKEIDIAFKKYKKESDSKIEALSEYYENMLAQKQAKEDEMENLLVSISECMHNEKVKSLVKEYQEKMSNHTTIMSDKINKIKAEYEHKLHALEVELYGKKDCKTKEE